MGDGDRMMIARSMIQNDDGGWAGARPANTAANTKQLMTNTAVGYGGDVVELFRRRPDDDDGCPDDGVQDGFNG